jgi:sporulation protein YlmC with PRC-barrel domain
MRNPFFTAAALVGMLVLPTIAPWAQEKSGGSTSLSSQHGAFSNSAHANDIIGKSAYSPTGESIGSINDLLIDANGRVQAAIVDVGGFLGVGKHTVAINWDQVKVNPSDDRVTVAMNKDELKAAPEYKKSAQATVPSSPQQAQTPSERKSVH